MSSTATVAAKAAGVTPGAGRTLRHVAKEVVGRRIMEGAGVPVYRTLGTGALRNLDPFLMLDELKGSAQEVKAGFPSHPHRGFSTVSIMLHGKIEHRDSVGNRGVLMDGGCQWMTAGRGIIHSEMPIPDRGEGLHGFQLWVNLPKAKKMVKPRYQDVQADRFTTLVSRGASEGAGEEAGPLPESTEGVSVRVLAGDAHGQRAPIDMPIPGTLLDVTIPPGGTWVLPDVPASWNGFAYVYEGSGTVGGGKRRTSLHGIYAFDSALDGASGGDIAATADKADALKLLVAFAEPIKERIVQYGPFVMNDELEIQQAFADYHSGSFQNPNDDVWAADE